MAAYVKEHGHAVAEGASEWQAKKKPMVIKAKFSLAEKVETAKIGASTLLKHILSVTFKGVEKKDMDKEWADPINALEAALVAVDGWASAIDDMYVEISDRLTTDVKSQALSEVDFKAAMLDTCIKVGAKES